MDRTCPTILPCNKISTYLCSVKLNMALSTCSKDYQECNLLGLEEPLLPQYRNPGDSASTWEVWKQPCPYSLVLVIPLSWCDVWLIPLVSVGHGCSSQVRDAPHRGPPLLTPEGLTIITSASGPQISVPISHTYPSALLFGAHLQPLWRRSPSPSSSHSLSFHQLLSIHWTPKPKPS